MILRKSLTILFLFGVNFFLSLYSQDIVINELMPLNGSTLADRDGDYSDWIELYNTGNQTIDMSGYGLTDNITKPIKWIFPHITVSQKEFLLVFASDKDIRDVSLVWETIIDKGDTWKYLVPYVEPPAGWRNTGFDDSSWNSGISGFGYGDDDDATVLPQIQSVFIRKIFIIDDVSICRKALLHIDYDDGFVAYLNGFEIARGNIGSPGIPPVYDQGTTTGTHEASMYSGGMPEEFEIDSVFKFLNQGENVLAIQVHNFNAGSSDLTAIPFFTLGLSEVPENLKGISPYLDIKPQELHTNFKINSSGESVYLFSNTGILLDSVQVQVSVADISMGRIPDGQDSIMFFSVPTPGRSNNTSGTIIISDKEPLFSHDAGFYPTSFSLILNADAGDTIYYTTDGSVPDRGSFRYQDPIGIGQSVVVRARIISNEETGALVSNTYIIGRNFDMPVISLSMEPDDLWDYYSGIYVEGPNAQQDIPHFGANYWMDWEKRAHIEFYEPDGSLGFEQDVGVKIFGQWSRAHPQKSMAVYARNLYGENQIGYDIFTFIPLNSFKSFVLRNSGNDFLYSTFRDLFHQSLVAGLDIDLLAYRPAVIYLNGAYWGIQNIREKISEHYIASHYPDIDKDSIDMLENYLNVIHGSSEDYTAMLEFIRGADITDSAVYNNLKSMMDVNNFIDYQFSQIYFDNTDWPGNNIKYWKKKSSDGRWRWIMYDTDFGFNLYDPNNYMHNTLKFAIEPNNRDEWPNPAWSTYLFQRLLQNRQFRIDFINHFADNLNSSFLPERVREQILYFRTKYQNEMPLHVQRWNNNISVWNSNIQNMLTFAAYRADYIRNHIRSQFGISGTHSVKLKVENPGSGKIKINTIMPLDYPWLGIYFDDIPVRLTARPEPGYRFIRWKGAVDSYEQNINVNVLSNLDFTAVFEPDGSNLNDIIINEINYNSASGSDAGDWIEIYNRGDEAKNISFWKISDSNNDHVYLIPGNTILEPEEFLVICRDTSLFTAQYPAKINYTGNFHFGLASSGDCVRLFAGEGLLVDSLCYRSVHPWPENSNGTGHSLALTDPFYENENPLNWISSENSGTPGYPNNILSDINKTVVTEDYSETNLLSGYPNPFNEFAYIRMKVGIADKIKVSIYDINGRLIEILANDYFNTGIYEFKWDTRDSEITISPGIYLVKMESSKSASVMKIIFIK